MNEKQLTQLKRPELQKLAKTHGVKANLKTEAIIAQLLERFPKGIPSGDVAEDGPTADGVPQFSEKADSAVIPPPRGRKAAGAKKRQQPRATSPKSAANDAGVGRALAAPVPGPSAKNTKKKSKIQPDNALGLVDEFPAARAVPQSVKITIKVPRVMAAPAVAAATCANAPHHPSPQAAASSVRTRTGREEDYTQVPALPEGLGPLYSISTGYPRSADRHAAMAFQQMMVPNLAEAVSRAINGPEPLDPSRITYDPEADATFDQSTSTNHPVFTFPSHAPTNPTDAYTPTTHARSYARAPLLAPPAPVPEPEQPEPRASAADTEAVVRKMIGISATHKARWREAHAHSAKATTLARSAMNLRNLVRQERAQRMRMRDFLVYWNPVAPGWREEDIWDRAVLTRIDEDGYEVELVSDDEEPVVPKQFRRPPGAKPTDIVMRRFAYRRGSEDQDVRVSEVLELTAERKLAPPSPSNKKRRCTPMDELQGAGQWPSKRARGANTPTKAAGTAGAVATAAIPLLGAITEDGDENS